MRTAIITGASRGLGRAFAIGLAQDGFALALSARDGDALAETAAAARAAGAPEVIVVPADLSQPEAAAHVVDATMATFGRVDVLVNNAGATKRGDFLELTHEDFIEGFALKYHATVRFCHAAWQALSASKGSIINISGVGAMTPEPDFTIGGSVNSALINFTKAISKRAQGSGIRINTLCPGHIVTDRLARRIEMRAQNNGTSFDEAREEMRIENGINAYGTPEEVCNVLRFLASPQASYVHGTVLTVDGGATPGI